MNNKTNRNKILIAVIVMILVTLACGTTRTEELRDAVNPTSTEIVLEPVEDKPETSEKVVEQGIEQQEALPTNMPEPTIPPATSIPEPEPIIVSKFGFGQDGQQAGYAFIVENPNAVLAFESSQYQIAAFDKDGVVIETDSGYIELILPGQKIGYAGDLYLNEGITIDKIEVQVNAGNAEAMEPIPYFSVESVVYFPDEYFSQATGVINNPFSSHFSDLKASAVVYDVEGNIIGGGYTYLNFVLANNSSGVEISVTSAGEVGSIEIYPTVSGLSVLSMDENTPDDAQKINLLKAGFGQDEFGAGYGIVIENLNPEYAIESSQYQVTAYSVEGTVLATDEGYIEVILPGQKLGIGGDLFLDDGMSIARFDAQILEGDYVESEQVPYFTTENVNFQSGSFSSSVTGMILSPYNTDITNVKIAAIAYDANGEIIGGGYTYLDFIPANSKAAAEVSVTVMGTPASVELYATLSGLSEFE